MRLVSVRRTVRRSLLALILLPLALLAASLRAAPGDLDAAFMTTVGTGFSRPLNAVAIESGGTILAGGGYGTFQGANTGVLWRLNPDGSLNQLLGGFAVTSGDPEINSIVVQPDGKILVAGVFDTVHGVSKRGVVRLNEDGSLDPNWNTSGSGIGGSTLRYVNDIVLAPDGSIYIGGGFTTYNNVFRMGVAKLFPNGTLDGSFSSPTIQSFEPGYGTFQGVVDGMALQADGRLIIGGSFNRLNNQVYGGIARLDWFGNVDPTFTSSPGADSRVNEVTILEDGRILCGGLASTYNGVSVPFTFGLSADGALDTTFGGALGSGSNGWTGGEVMQLPGGDLLLAGIFNTWQGQPVSSIVRLNTDGTRDTSLATTPYTSDRNNYITHFYSIARQSDGKLVVGGWFSTPDSITNGLPVPLAVNGTPTYNILRFEGDYSAGPGEIRISPIAYSPIEYGGSVIIRAERVNGTQGSATVDFSTAPLTASAGADYTPVSGTLSWGAGQGGVRTFVIPILQDALQESPEVLTVSLANATGATLSAASNALVTILDDDSLPQIIVQPASFTINQGNLTTVSIAPFSVLPMTFQWYRNGTPIPGATLPAYSFIAEAGVNDGDYTVVVSNSVGSVTSDPGTVTILVPAGTRDPSFTASSSIGGMSFTLRLSDGSFVYLSGSTLRRATATGQPDASFTPPNLSGVSIYTLAVDAFDRILVGGSFTSVAGQTRNNLFRLLPDGTLDTTFVPAYPGTPRAVSAILPLPDGSVITGHYSGAGIFRLTNTGANDTTFVMAAGIGEGVANGSITALARQSDGRILVSSVDNPSFGTIIRRIRRLNTNGSLDATFNIATPNSSSSLFTLLPDGRIVVAGGFTTINGTARQRVAILRPDGSLDPLFALSEAPNNNINSVLFHDGYLLLGGTFTTVGANAINRIARYRLDGTLDTTFVSGSGFNSAVDSLFTDALGRILVAGSFTNYNGLSANYLTRLVRGPGSVGFTSAAFSSLENTGTLTVTIRRFGDATAPASVSYSVSANTAIAGTDFTSSSGLIEWAAGDGSDKTVAFTLLDDALDEGTESFNLSLARIGDGIQVSMPAAVASIIDDERWPKFTLQPQNATSLEGGTASFSVTATSPTTLSYQWLFNGSPLSNGGIISGANTATLTLTGVTYANEGSYSVRVTNAEGFALSSTASLDVQADPSLRDPALPVTNFNLNGSINSLIPLEDGGVIIAGSFINAGGISGRHYLARYNAAGAIVSTFAPVIDSTVTRVLRDGPDHVLILGTFTNVNSAAVNRLARLSITTGASDTTFNANMASTGNDILTSAVRLQDGTLLVGGYFTSWGGTTNRRALVRLTSNGAFQSTFGAALASTPYRVMDLAARPGGKVLVAHWDSVSTATNRLVLLNSDGTRDNSFSLSLGNHPTRLLQLRDGGMLLLGSTLFNSSHLVRLTSSLAIDPGFTASGAAATGAVTLMDATEQVNGRIVVVGQQNITGSRRIQRYLANGAIDASFPSDPAFDAAANAVAVLRDGKIWVGGAFSTYKTVTVNRLVRLQGDPVELAFYRHPTSLVVDPGQTVQFTVDAFGTPTPTYSWHRNGIPVENGPRITGADTATLIISNAEESDNGSYTCVISNVTGSLTSSAASLLVRGAPVILTQSGSTSAFTGNTFQFAITAEGAPTLTYQWRRNGTDLTSGGRFTGTTTPTLTVSGTTLADAGTYTVVVTNSIGSTESQGITLNVALNPAGIAAGFSTFTVNGDVNVILPIEGGRALVGGSFTSFSDGITTRTSRLVVVREDGRIDTSANPTVDGPVFAIHRTTSGKYLIGGNFATFDGDYCPRIVQLNSDLTRDTSFTSPEPTSTVRAIASDVDNRVYIGGEFASDLGGVLGTKYFARLNANGSVDTSLTHGISGAVVALAKDNGGILIGGGFVNADGNALTNDNYLVRFTDAGPQDLTFNPTAIVWFNVNALLGQPNGDVLFSFQFLANYGRISATGSASTFNPPASNGTINSFALLPDQRIVLGGSFTSISTTRNRLAVLQPGGALDTSFDFSTGANGAVNTVATTASGKIWAGGAFTTFNGAPAQRLILIQGTAPAAETFAAYAARVGIPGGGANPNDDSDSDGIADIIEFILGGNATNSDAQGLLRPVELATAAELGLPGNDFYVVQQFRIRNDITGVTWSVVHATSPLGFGTPSETEAIEVGTPVPDGTHTIRTFRAPVSGAGYLRLRVE